MFVEMKDGTFVNLAVAERVYYKIWANYKKADNDPDKYKHYVALAFGGTIHILTKEEKHYKDQNISQIRVAGEEEGAKLLAFIMKAYVDGKKILHFADFAKFTYDEEDED